MNGLNIIKPESSKKITDFTIARKTFQLILRCHKKMRRITKMKMFSKLMSYCLVWLAFACSSAGHHIVHESPEKNGEETPGNKTDEDVKPTPKTRYGSFDLVGVDQFGHAFPTISGYRKNRTVGLFYWPWIGQPYASGIYDATKIAAMPNGIKILTDFNAYDETVSPNGQAHYWGEPLWGYYNSDDEWVIRKQMQMIMAAGVDFIFFDTTNAIIYKDVVLKVCRILDEMIQAGWNPPKVAFYTHSHSFQTTRDLYEALYKVNQYPDTWFRVDGKPLIIAYTNPADDLAEAASRNDNGYNPGTLSPEILNFFHFMKPQWPSDPVFPDGFPWIEWKFPQPFHAASGVMNVTVASHPGVPMSFSLTRSGWINWGRGWNVTTRRNVSADVDRGTFFQSEWDRAIKADPPMISVGGWNEWIAYKQPYMGEYMLCDAASKEYSRDIEPMKGGYEDAFYLQLISNVRRYKGLNVGKAMFQTPKTINLDGKLSQWNDVVYVQRNPEEKFIHRDAYGGARSVRYIQQAPTDKIEEIRVSHDDENLYFYIRGKENFSRYSGKENWLNLFIGCGEPELKSWESYDHVVKAKAADAVSVQEFTDGFQSIEKGTGRMVVKENVILVSFPRAALGKFSKFYFKIAMGVKSPSDIMNSYLTGSSMPMGRLSYLYVIEN